MLWQQESLEEGAFKIMIMISASNRGDMSSLKWEPTRLCHILPVQPGDKGPWNTDKASQLCDRGLVLIYFSNLIA